MIKEEEQKQLEILKLEFDRGKHRDEMLLKREELEVRKTETLRARWQSPLFLAVVAAIFGLFSNAAVALLNGKSERDLEDKKAEAARIIEALKTGNPDVAAENLKLLVEAGLVTDSASKIQAYLNNRQPGEGAQLPVATAATQAKNYKQREGPIRSIIVHATETPRTDSLDNLVEFYSKSESPGSTHYLIGADGRTVKILDEAYAAIAVGPASDPKFSNQSSISISLVGLSNEGFAEEQVTALENLLVDIARRNHIDVNDIVGHKDVTVPPGRKIDPGPHLDLEKIRAVVRSKL